MVLETSGGMSSSLAMIAGGTPFAGTDLQKSLGIEDSADALYEEAVRVSGGSPELWRAIAITSWRSMPGSSLSGPNPT